MCRPHLLRRKPIGQSDLITWCDHMYLRCDQCTSGYFRKSRAFAAARSHSVLSPSRAFPFAAESEHSVSMREKERGRGVAAVQPVPAYGSLPNSQNHGTPSRANSTQSSGQFFGAIRCAQRRKLPNLGRRNRGKTMLRAPWLSSMSAKVPGIRKMRAIRRRQQS